MLLGAHLAGLAFSNAPVAGVHALAYPLGGLHHLPHGLSNALMLRHVLAAQCRGGARPLCRARADPRSRIARGRAARRARALLIDRLDRLVADSGLAPRLRDHGIALDEHPDARARSDEADAAAGEQSLRDHRSRRAAALRGGLVSREPPAHAIRLSRSGATITTRWADNDAYGHVNNTVYYDWFDTAVNAWLVEQGLLDIAARRSDRPGRRNRLQLFRAARLSRAGRGRTWRSSDSGDRASATGSACSPRRRTARPRRANSSTSVSIATAAGRSTMPASWRAKLEAIS